MEEIVKNRLNRRYEQQEKTDLSIIARCFCVDSLATLTTKPASGSSSPKAFKYLSNLTSETTVPTFSVFKYSSPLHDHDIWGVNENLGNLDEPSTCLHRLKQNFCLKLSQKLPDVSAPGNILHWMLRRSIAATTPDSSLPSRIQASTWNSDIISVFEIHGSTLLCRNAYVSNPFLPLRVRCLRPLTWLKSYPRKQEVWIFERQVSIPLRHILRNMHLLKQERCTDLLRLW